MMEEAVKQIDQERLMGGTDLEVMKITLIYVLNDEEMGL